VPNHKVTAVDPNPPRSWNSAKGGPMLSYRVDLARVEDDFAIRNVEWSKKQDSKPPQVGEVIDCTVDMEAQYGPKLKVNFTQGGGGGGGGGRGWVPEPPEKRRSIAMQHAQKCAVEILAVAAAHGDYKPPSAGDVAGQVKTVAQALFAQVIEAEKEPTDG
jgi:hypothetical protein